MSQPARSAPSTLMLVAATTVAAVVIGLFLFRPVRASGQPREWTAADHDQPAGAEGQPPPSKAGKGLPKGGGPDGNLVELAWGKSCATCHGSLGRGDGPQGPMVKAPDLTRREWQDRVTDDQIRETITKGKGQMPKFDLPPNVLAGIVARIRNHRVDR